MGNFDNILNKKQKSNKKDEMLSAFTQDLGLDDMQKAFNQSIGKDSISVPETRDVSKTDENLSLTDIVKNSSGNKAKISNDKSISNKALKTFNESGTDRSFAYKPIYDLSDPRAVKIKRKSKGDGKGDGLSIYISKEVSTILNELCQKYNMSKSECISTLIINSK